MSLRTYDVSRWDNVSIKSSLRTNAPALYVYPDKELLEYVRQSDFKVPIKVSNSRSTYDDLTTIAVCQPSQNTAGYRPNFQAETNLIVFVLDCEWQGYPTETGQISVLIDLVKPESSILSFENFVSGGTPYCTIALIFLIVLWFMKNEEQHEYM